MRQYYTYYIYLQWFLALWSDRGQSTGIAEASIKVWPIARWLHITMVFRTYFRVRICVGVWRGPPYGRQKIDTLILYCYVHHVAQRAPRVAETSKRSNRSSPNQTFRSPAAPLVIWDLYINHSLCSVYRSTAHTLAPIVCACQRRSFVGVYFSFHSGRTPITMQ